MGEKSIADMTVDILVERQRLVKTELQKRFKRTKPFRMEPIKNEDLLYDYNTRGMEIFKEILETQGEETAMEYKNQMEALKVEMGGKYA